MQRHDLLLLSGEEQERIFRLEGLAKAPLFLEKKRKLEAEGYSFQIPAIVRRQETEAADVWDVGFSFPWLEGGLRARVSASVEERRIQKIITPYDLLQQPTAVSRYKPDGKWPCFLGIVKELGKEYQITPGLYGSVGLWLATGLPYLHEDSDLDINIPAASMERMEAFYRKTVEAALGCGIIADVEIRVRGLGDIKAQELFSSQLTVIVRGLKNTWLENRENLEKLINKKGD